MSLDNEGVLNKESQSGEKHIVFTKSNIMPVKVIKGKTTVDTDDFSNVLDLTARKSVGLASISANVPVNANSNSKSKETGG